MGDFRACKALGYGQSRVLREVLEGHKPDVRSQECSLGEGRPEKRP